MLLSQADLFSSGSSLLEMVQGDVFRPEGLSAAIKGRYSCGHTALHFEWSLDLISMMAQKRAQHFLVVSRGL